VEQVKDGIVNLIARLKASALVNRLLRRKYSTTDDPQEVPVQKAAYHYFADRVVNRTDRVLDIGFGLGYGACLLAEKAKSVAGVDVDEKAVRRAMSAKWPSNAGPFVLYDGRSLPFENGAIDVITCVDVLEHVQDYEAFLMEMTRVAKRAIALSTPNRRPEFTKPDGSPKNYWHLREWNHAELDEILKRLKGWTIDWRFVDGPFEGPFDISAAAGEKTMALTPILFKE